MQYLTDFHHPPTMFQSDRLCQGLFTLPSSLQQLFLFHVSTLVSRHLSCLDHMPISYPNLQSNSWLLLPHTLLCSQPPHTPHQKLAPCPPGETSTRFCSWHSRSAPLPKPWQPQPSTSTVFSPCSQNPVHFTCHPSRDASAEVGTSPCCEDMTLNFTYLSYPFYHFPRHALRLLEEVPPCPKFCLLPRHPNLASQVSQLQGWQPQACLKHSAIFQDLPVHSTGNSSDGSPNHREQSLYFLWPNPLPSKPPTLPASGGISRTENIFSTKALVLNYY